MSPATRPRRVLLAVALAIVAFVLALSALNLGPGAIRFAQALPSATAAAAALRSDPSRVCVTRVGLCPIGAVRAGDPCSCPDPVQGNVVGHVEKLAGPLTGAEPRDWPQDGEEALPAGP